MDYLEVLNSKRSRDSNDNDDTRANENNVHVPNTSDNRLDSVTSVGNIMVEQQAKRPRIAARPRVLSTASRTTVPLPLPVTSSKPTNSVLPTLPSAQSSSVDPRAFLDSVSTATTVGDDKSVSSIAFDPKEGDHLVLESNTVLNERYRVKKAFGHGVFATVYKCVDESSTTVPPTEADEVVPEAVVAIKAMRNAALHDATARHELSVLQELWSGADNSASGRAPVVRPIGEFAHEGHTCLVLEALEGGTLRDLAKEKGGKLSACDIRVFSYQFLEALRFLKSFGYIHGDVKMDNVLLTADRSRIVLADFGAAHKRIPHAITRRLAARLYRPPEIILGLHYSYGVDLWCFGCCLYEMCTARRAFRGATELHVFRDHLAVSGMVPRALLERSMHAAELFGKDFEKCTPKRERDLIAEIRTRGSSDPYFLLTADLIKKIFFIDPPTRLTVEQAMNHKCFNSDVDPRVVK